jgi:hypothetical protein
MSAAALRLQNAILDCLVHSFKLADGSMTQGIAVSRIASELRDRGWKNIPSGFAYNLAPLGFCLKDGFAGKWTKGGYQYCQPCQFVTL